jgi:hypothetical protein
MYTDNHKPLPKLGKNKALIVACTKHFFGADYVSDFDLPQSLGLQGVCRFSDDLSLMDEADALWFHGPSIRKLPVKKKHQKWIVACMESEANYPFLAKQEIMDMFDIKMTYRLDSDVPMIYPKRSTYGAFYGSPVCLAEKDLESSPVVYIASNPVPARDQYVRKLMEYVSVDSLGSCLNNRNADFFNSPRSQWGHNRGGFDAVAHALGKYKFYICIENSNCQDYVTERVLMALAFGCVPIYMGAPNIRDFLPAENCIVDASQFSSPAELAAHIKYLDNDDSAYNDLLEWRKKGPTTQFLKLLDVGDIEPKHRMLIKLLHEWGAECLCGGRIR